MKTLAQAVLIAALALATAVALPAPALADAAPPSSVGAVRDHRTLQTTVPAKRGTAPQLVAPSTAVPEALSFIIDEGMQSQLRTMQWTLKAGSDGRPILSGNQYRLANQVSMSGIAREKRLSAANLGWLPQNSTAFNMRIKRQAGDGQVRYGDIVALELHTYGWLRYKEQSRGINLSDDDNNPHYIWQIKGATKGTKLVAGMPFALYNTRAGSEMTYCVRTYGIDLGWEGKSTCGGRLAQASLYVFGRNGLFHSDGHTGKAGQLLKAHLCEAGVSAAVAGITALSGGAGGAAALAAPIAIQECKEV